MEAANIRKRHLWVRFTHGLKIVYPLDRASRMKISLTCGRFPLLSFFSTLQYAHVYVSGLGPITKA